MHETIDDLLGQAERAERLARTGMDPLTLERLRAFATECRNQIATVLIARPSSRSASRATLASWNSGE